MEPQLEQRSQLFEEAVRVHERLNLTISSIKDLASRLGGRMERRLSDDGPISDVSRGRHLADIVATGALP